MTALQAEDALSQRKLYAYAWSAHDAAARPETLQLHVERQKDNDQELSFREMCGESAFIPESELTSLSRVGSGSFASVDICKYRPPGAEERIVAVKRLTSKATVDIAQFASEANTLSKLEHPSIVGYIGVGSVDAHALVRHHTKSSCYMVQEYVDGGTLKQKVWKQVGVSRHLYSDHDAIQWGKQIAEGLAYLHSANPVVLHRDLKLENILLKKLEPASKVPQFAAKICDFGLSVSLLEPSCGYRQLLPSGLSNTRFNTDFHQQMKQHVEGGGIDHMEISQSSAQVDAGLSRISVNPGFIAGAAMSRGAPLPPSSSPSKKSLRKGLSFNKGNAVAADVNEAPQNHEAYDLTGRAGSFIYMAPEVTMCQPYDEKVDIFSLGVILFELFLRKPLAAVLSEIDNNPGTVEMFAYKVAGGYRHPMPQDWPQELQQLISNCWHQNPACRPAMPEVVRQLGSLEDSELFRKWEEYREASTPGCCSVQ